MRGLLFLTAFVAFPVFAQPVEALAESQRADYRKLVGQYRDIFRLLGKSKLCGLGFQTEPFYREVAARHGEAPPPRDRPGAARADAVRRGGPDARRHAAAGSPAVAR